MTPKFQFIQNNLYAFVLFFTFYVLLLTAEIIEHNIDSNYTIEILFTKNVCLLILLFIIQFLVKEIFGFGQKLIRIHNFNQKIWNQLHWSFAMSAALCSFCSFLLNKTLIFNVIITILILHSITFLSALLIIRQNKVFFKKTLLLKRNENPNIVNINDTSKLFVKGKSKTDRLLICKSDFYFIKSEENYCKIFFNEDQKKVSKIFRSSLKDIENQIDCDKIIRVHKSYIINLSRVAKITGNVNKTHAILSDQNQTKIPIGRSKRDDVIKKFQITLSKNVKENEKITYLKKAII